MDGYFETVYWGSIISELHIITAAHCFESVALENITVTAGVTCISGSCRTGHKVKKLSIHPLYETEKIEILQANNVKEDFKTSDIAILTLETALIFGEKVQPIALPTKEPDFSPELSICDLAGWGSQSSSTVNSGKLLSTSIQLEKLDDQKLCQIRNKLICGRNPDRATHVEEGDSGAGLMCQGVLTGVFVGSGDNVHHPSIFQSVYNFLPFIHGILEADTRALTLERNKPKERNPRPCICL